MVKVTNDNNKLYFNRKGVNRKEGNPFHAYTPSNRVLLGTGINRFEEGDEAAWVAWANQKNAVPQEHSSYVMNAEENLGIFSFPEKLEDDKPFREMVNADVPLTPQQLLYFAGSPRFDEDGEVLSTDLIEFLQIILASAIRNLVSELKQIKYS